MFILCEPGGRDGKPHIVGVIPANNIFEAAYKLGLEITYRKEGFATVGKSIQGQSPFISEVRELSSPADVPDNKYFEEGRIPPSIFG